MQKKANIYAPLDGHNEGWLVEIIDERYVNTGLHYMDWSLELDAMGGMTEFSNTQDFFPGSYSVAVYENNRDKPTLRGRVVDGALAGFKYA